ncbi:DHS-like NAD/FAD-binding domain-containing protein [Cytidiella melzeri]|nr:DHS-like NAD/FAD-binding domain-containing protein [Cytidiella melzeri]
MHKPSPDMNAFRKTLRESKHIIAVAGAGLSAASGIGTFRGAGGLWRKYDAMSLATPEAFRKSPSTVWQFYHYRREKALHAPINAAHSALAKFSLNSVRENIAPGSTFTLITQNVDGISQRALDQVRASDPFDNQGGRPAILEMHGRLFDVVCSKPPTQCGHRELNFTSPICGALRGTEDLVEQQHVEPSIPLADLPRCSKCGALARPGVVWFGERPHHMPKIDELVGEADLCLVVGTSSTVYPAAGYAAEVQDHGGKVAVFNLERSEGDEDADFLFLGPCETTLPEALSLVSP